MSEDRRRILEMVAKGAISVDEAERLLQAVGADAPVTVAERPAAKRLPKYLRVIVNSVDNDQVNVRVPLQLIRAGVKLGALLPKEAQGKVEEALEQKGVTFDFDIKNLTPENIESLIEALGELAVDIDSKDGDVVRVFCE